jgi:hypothetical protein
MSSHGRSGGALIRPQHRNLISNKNHNCNAKNEQAAKDLWAYLKQFDAQGNLKK